MDSKRLDRIEKKLDTIEEKLDAALRAEVSVGWLRWVVGGAWVAIAGLFALHK